MKQRDKERYRIYDQNARDQKSKTFYDSREWQLTRSDILSACGIDVYVYMTEGVILAADTVHHIIPLKEAWDKRCDKQNLIPLHHDTHSKIEQMYKKEKPVMEKKLAKMLVDFYAQTEGRSEKFLRNTVVPRLPCSLSKILNTHKKLAKEGGKDEWEGRGSR